MVPNINVLEYLNHPAYFNCKSVKYKSIELIAKMSKYQIIFLSLYF